MFNESEKKLSLDETQLRICNISISSGFSCLFKQAGYAIIYLDRIVDTDIGRILLKGGMPMVYVFVDVSSERSTLVTA